PTHSLQLHSFPPRRSSDLPAQYHGLKFSSADAGPALPEITKDIEARASQIASQGGVPPLPHSAAKANPSEKVNLRQNYLTRLERSEEHTSELQSPDHIVCR